MRSDHTTAHGWVLHRRPYRETSALVDVWTEDVGRLRLVVRGLRSPRSRWRGICQPFVPLWFRWKGQGDLATCYQLETQGAPVLLQGMALGCGLYVNELLLRTTRPLDPHPCLMPAYQSVLHQLARGDAPDISLRGFEREVLDAIGYGIPWSQLKTLRDAGHRWASFDPAHGFQPSTNPEDVEVTTWVAVAQACWDDPVTRRAAKHLFRHALRPHLGTQGLQSRDFFLARHACASS